MLRQEKFGTRKKFELCIKRDDNKAIFFFRFIYFGKEGGPKRADVTHCTLIIHLLQEDNKGVYVFPITGEAKKHPDDIPNWKIGARVSAKKAIFGINDEIMSVFGVTKRELYNAFRYAVPLN